MGEVWCVRDEQLRLEVVAKRVPEESTAEQIEILRRECRNARRLSHPNIVRVYDFHQAEPTPFITMELIEGHELCELRGGRPEDILRALLPVAEALDHAHRLDIVHRDLKCSNVLMDAAGEPHVADFGIAGSLAPAVGEAGLVGGGTPRHASSQQLGGEPPSVADDVYGFGCLIHELISGEPPFPPAAGTDSPQGAPEPALASRYAVPGSLKELTARMLAGSPEDRPAGMAEVADGLRRALDELAEESTVPPSRVSSGVRLTPPPRVSSPPPITEVGAGSGRPGSGSARPGPWTLLAFTLAFASLVLVFAVLPGWVGRSSERAGPAPLPEEDSSGFAQRAPEPVGSGSPRVEAAVPPRLGAEPEARRGAPGDPPRSKGLSPRRAPAAGLPAAAGTSPSSRGPNRAFAEAMTEGLAARDRGDHAAAREAFERAVGLLPGSVDAEDALAAAELELRLSEIGARRLRAAELESAERWRAALEEYEAVQAIDPTILFAQEGLARTRRRAELDDKLTRLVGAPTRLAAAEVLADARVTLAAAEAAEPRGPRLEDQIRRLTRAIAAAGTPVEVLLLSDAATEVWLYRVGRLGSFERRTLELRPGRYTVVGSREGFRDVRLELEVRAGESPAPLVVRCEERI